MLPKRLAIVYMLIKRECSPIVVDLRKMVFVCRNLANYYLNQWLKTIKPSWLEIPKWVASGGVSVSADSIGSKCLPITLYGLS